MLPGLELFDAAEKFLCQAEDGIRDLIVTGVQTCALPICPQRTLSPTSCPGRTAPFPERSCTLWTTDRATGRGKLRRSGKGRSEERRVGKERRSRWSPYH